ncbi:type II toxin-antitoxin system antitoxin SocA domain-containing protein [Pseudanabaena galeata UHCC 0370]|uniref:Type II toxin-antitoxin system antitoxin SocA domain-containing protein n=2 Tax=Pseudanabaena galeata TaxID=1112103 RepID=A0ABU5TLK3_9CYAN|nr:type II toxin-antitoxin system antitoxin SocA domain-containing protein [Pseudanabaena galeata]MEA5479085.1 type II toxin-antitoxin system antitoxin SocA domain-containing protein [Pseudanabaena galeata UHCC 0370]
METSMLEKLILFFVCKSKGYITKTQLVKFLYLADLYSVKWTKKQLTNLDWRYYRFGPWSEDIDSCLKDLYTQGVLGEVQNNQAVLIEPRENCPDVDGLRFSKGLELMLRNIRKEWIGAKLDDLLAYVYQTEPMLEAKEHHQPEDMAHLNLFLEHEKIVAELGV